MNILVSGMGWIDHTPGGLNRYFADYVNAMVGHGHQISGLMTAGGEKTTAPSYVRDVLGNPQQLGTFARMRAFRQAIRNGLSSEQPDVYNPHFALYASMVNRGLVPSHIPIVTHFHGPWAHESMVEDKGGALAQRIRHRLRKEVEQLSYRRSDHFIVLSQYFKDILSHDYGAPASRIHIVPGAVDHERFQPSADREALRRERGLTANQKVLFCARRLVQRMGIDRLIQAMVEVKRVVPEVVLFIAGQGALRTQLEQMIEELNLQSTVTLLGKISNEDLVRWYQAADLSMVPTVTLEGFGLVTVESLSCGTPVLGTPYGGTKEILGQFDPALLFEDSTPEAIASKLKAVLTGECSIPSRNDCREHVLQHYTWERVAARVTDIFAQAVEERKVKRRA